MFKDRFKEARKLAGLSQEKLGSLMGISKQTVSDYERGYSEPDMAKIGIAMNILNVDANYLWQDEMNDAEAKPITAEALAVARAYDDMSSYGRAVIDCVVKQEQKLKQPAAASAPAGRMSVPVIETAHDSDLYARYHSQKEQEELHKEQKTEKNEE